MNELALFQYEGKDVRAIQGENGEPWWVLKDVCEVLDLNSPHKVAERLDEDEKERNLIPTLGGEQEMTVINESGLYSVILRSNKPEAKSFKRWVTRDVLPALRRQGYYSVMPREELYKQLRRELQYYDHFVEDTILPVLEEQTELSFNDLMYRWFGFQINTKDDFNWAKKLFDEKAGERRQRMSAMRHNLLDFRENEPMLRAIMRFKWNAPENMGHHKKVKGIRWFDDFILEKLQTAAHP